MTETCRVCGAARLAGHLTVKSAGRGHLVATTTSYGSAPDDIVRCAGCGHMQVASFPASAALGEAYAEVSEAAYVAEERGQRATAARTLAQIERHVGRGRLCDLGCWVGYLLSEARARGWEGWGVEPSRFAAQYAREVTGVEVLCATIEAVPLPHAKLQAVVLGDVIEHLPEPGEALDRIHAALAPGGVVHLALPDAGSAVARALGARWWSVLPTHVHYFTRPSLAALLARHGFSVELMTTAPKAFSVRYYLQRLEGYSPPSSAAAVAVAGRLGVAERLVWPDFRDRMAVVARRRERRA